jgi:hypothetical protein
VPYITRTGSYERASRTGHVTAAVRAMAERAEFYVPAEHTRDVEWLQDKVCARANLAIPQGSERLRATIAVDGSRTVVEARPGLPSVRYGYAQAAAVYLDLDALDAQREELFVDPVALQRAYNQALIALDMPVAGAYLRPGISLKRSWRERIDRIFCTKRVDVNGLNQTLLDLLALLHGRPGAPASSLPVTCPACSARDVAVPFGGAGCPSCGERLFSTDVLRIHEDVVDDGSNEEPLGRLMQAIELLVMIGLLTLLWGQRRDDLLTSTLFILDGPLAVFGPPAKLRARALDYVQAIGMSTRGIAPYVCGIEKTGTFVDYARGLARHDALAPGEVLVVDADVISHITHTPRPQAYGSETYWGRKFFYRALDGRVVVLTIPPAYGSPYDDHGGQPDIKAYPTLPAILGVIDRTGSSMYFDGIIPVALAHGAAAYPIGVGTDVLRLVARQKLGLDDP